MVERKYCCKDDMSAAECEAWRDRLRSEFPNVVKIWEVERFENDF